MPLWHRPYCLLVQAVLLATAVPLHCPLLLQMSVVHSFPSLQAVLGVQLPVHALLTHACAEHALHVLPLVPPPHVDTVWLATGTHALPLQQPLQDELASHTQAPPEHRCPAPQTVPQVPQLLLSVWVLVQVPLLPHGVSPAVQAHAPLWQVLPPLHGPQAAPPVPQSVVLWLA